ncbi:MAG: hypothetical protein HN991_02875 [Candidatus Jacksonbacteria bacterium]|nr:hypothetical protein [Candidatus Jacksonbacteria bacterium]
MKRIFTHILLVSMLAITLVGIGAFQLVQAAENGVDDIQLQFEYPGGITTGGKKLCAHTVGTKDEKECTTDKDCDEGEFSPGLCVLTNVVLKTGENNDPGSALYVFLNNIYKLAIVIASMAAVLMLVVGGYKWIFAGGNSSVVDSAKKTIKGAILGLVIALLSFSILQIVNPKTLDISISKHLSSVDRIDQFVGGANTSYIARCLPEFNVQATGTGELSTNGSLGVCGSTYIIENLDDLNNAEIADDRPAKYDSNDYPKNLDGKPLCYGLTCYEGLGPGDFRRGGSFSPSTDNCVPRTDNNVGFVCDSNRVGRRNDSVTAQVAIEMCGAESAVGPTSCTNHSIESVIPATSHEYFCRWEDTYNAGQGLCYARKIAECTNNALQLKCDGNDIQDKRSVFTELGPIPQYTFMGFDHARNECSRAQRVDGDPKSCYTTNTAPENFPYAAEDAVCCAKTEGASIADVASIKEEIIDCRSPFDSCNSNEVQVACSIFDDEIGTPYEDVHWGGAVNQNTCAASNGASGKCCWHVQLDFNGSKAGAWFDWTAQ